MQFLRTFFCLDRDVRLGGWESTAVHIRRDSSPHISLSKVNIGFIDHLKKEKRKQDQIYHENFAHKLYIFFILLPIKANRARKVTHISKH